ncbi:MAG: hypothetical protein IPO41_13770 [Acidobacteria bacterium]|nr:hypothetical protein [Acidobacteriota bacterium]
MPRTSATTEKAGEEAFRLISVTMIGVGSPAKIVSGKYCHIEFLDRCCQQNPTIIAAMRKASTRKSRLFPVFQAENPTISISTIITAPPVVNSNGKFICDASRPAFRARGGTTNNTDFLQYLVQILSASRIRFRTTAERAFRMTRWAKQGITRRLMSSAMQ